VISIDIVNYAAGELGPDAVNIFYVTARGGQKMR
jgi:hypothetical protein